MVVDTVETSGVVVFAELVVVAGVVDTTVGVGLVEVVVTLVVVSGVVSSVSSVVQAVVDSSDEVGVGVVLCVVVFPDEVGVVGV